MCAKVFISCSRRTASSDHSQLAYFNEQGAFTKSSDINKVFASGIAIKRVIYKLSIH